MQNRQGGGEAGRKCARAPSRSARKTPKSSALGCGPGQVHTRAAAPRNGPHRATDAAPAQPSGGKLGRDSRPYDLYPEGPVVDAGAARRGPRQGAPALTPWRGRSPKSRLRSQSCPPSPFPTCTSPTSPSSRTRASSLTRPPLNSFQHLLSLLSFRSTP